MITECALRLCVRVKIRANIQYDIESTWVKRLLSETSITWMQSINTQKFVSVKWNFAWTLNSIKLFSFLFEQHSTWMGFLRFPFGILCWMCRCNVCHFELVSSACFRVQNSFYQLYQTREGERQSKCNIGRVLCNNRFRTRWKKLYKFLRRLFVFKNGWLNIKVMEKSNHFIFIFICEWFIQTNLCMEFQLNRYFTDDAHTASMHRVFELMWYWLHYVCLLHFHWLHACGVQAVKWDNPCQDREHQCTTDFSMFAFHKHVMQ